MISSAPLETAAVTPPPAVTNPLALVQRATTSALPPTAAPLLSNSTFPQHGPCSKVPRMVHGLTYNGFVPVDTYGLSCTNGWTGGDWAGSAADAASIVQSLWGRRGSLLTPSTADEMLSSMKPLDTGSWGIGVLYGLGTMDMGSQLPGVYCREPGVLVGHGGETFGFTGTVGYIAKINASLAVFANAEDGVATESAVAGALTLLGV